MSLRTIAAAACGVVCLSLLGCSTPEPASVEGGAKPGQGMSDAQKEAMMKSRRPPAGVGGGAAAPGAPATK